MLRLRARRREELDASSSYNLVGTAGRTPGEHPVGSRGYSVVRGAARGVVAAMAMTGMRTLTKELGVLPRTPPEQVLARDGVGLIEHVPEHLRKVVEELAHWAYGGFGGAAFGALPRGVRRSRWAGPGLGLFALLSFEAVVVPVLGLPDERRRGAAERVVLAVDHLLYGLVVAGSTWPHEI